MAYCSRSYSSLLVPYHLKRAPFHRRVTRSYKGVKLRESSNKKPFRMGTLKCTTQYILGSGQRYLAISGLYLKIQIGSYPWNHLDPFNGQRS